MEGMIYFPAKAALRFSRKARVPSPVLGRRGEAECRSLETQALLQPAIQAHVHRFEGKRDRLRPVGQHLLHPRPAKRQQLLERRDVIHQAQPVSFRGVDGLARDKHVDRAATAHKARQTLCAAVSRHKTEFHFRLAELCIR